MAETPTQSEFDQKVRANLAYIWSGAIIVMVGYVLYQWGSILAVLTLIVGFVTGTAATILAVYFGAPIAAKKADTAITGDNTVVNNPTKDKPADIVDEVKI